MVIDTTTNSYCDILLEFLIDCNLCMLNGRLGTHDFTHISTRGKSVVDYVFVPHEQFASFSEFSVQSMSDIVGEYNLHDYKSSDHSISLWSKRIPCDIDTLNQATDASNPSPIYDKKYVYVSQRLS